MSPAPLFLSRRAVVLPRVVSGGGGGGGPTDPLTDISGSTLPPFTPSRTVTVTNPSQLSSAISGLIPGDLVNVSAFDAPGEIVISGKNLGSPARFVFAPGWRATGAASGTQLPAFYMNNSSNIQLVGGDVTGAGNQGVRMDSCQNILWHDLYIHDTAGTGLMVQGLTRASPGMDIEARVTHCGLDLSLDPHAEKGTGNHGCYIGQDSYPVAGRFVLDVWNQTVGACVQMGQTNGVNLWVRGIDITKIASSQVAGNVLQLWGSISNLNVHYLYGDRLGGRAVDPSGVYGMSSSVVQYGRAFNYRLSPAYLPWSGITYQDCV